MRAVTLVAALGAAQGLLLLILITARYRCRKNVPFALFLLLFSLRLGTIPGWSSVSVALAPWLLALVGPVPLLFGPLLWWYVLALVHHVESPPRHFWLHTIPWVLETALLSAFLLTRSATQYREVSQGVFATPPAWWMTVRHVTKILHGGAYAVVSGRIVFGEQGKSAPIESSERRWARTVVIAPLLSMVAFAIAVGRPVVAASSPGGEITLLYLPALIMTATIYGFALVLITAPSLLAPDSGCREPRGVIRRMKNSEVERIAGLIREHLDSGAYLDPNLTEGSLARALGLPPKVVSAVLNHAFGERFWPVVHRKRLDHFLRRAAVGDLGNHTILELALETGFASKSTFNRVFKEYYGVSPSAYLQAELYKRNQLSR